MGKLVKLHMWIGACASLLLVIMAVTGLILDHREQFSQRQGRDQQPA
jgi:hypothetical protein